MEMEKTKQIVIPAKHVIPAQAGIQSAILTVIFVLVASLASFASTDTTTTDTDLKVIEVTPQSTDTTTTQDPQIQAEQAKVQSQMSQVQPQTASKVTGDESVRYTLGPDDTVEVTVLRHPEFSGTFPVNQEGKIQLKFIDDILVTGLTKKELEEKIKNAVSAYVINPEVNVTIIDYRSKFVYIIGEVGQPGKFYIRSEDIKVRDAVTMAGLPTESAAMRKCQIITPDKTGRPKIKAVDLYAILYKGNLKKDLDMKAGDVLYVPSTVMAKLIRMINPVTATVNGAASGPSGVSSGKSAATSLVK